MQRWLQSWDTATRPSELNSYCVCTTWGINGKTIISSMCDASVLNHTGLKMCSEAGAPRPSTRRISSRSRSSGTQLIEDLIAEGVQGVTWYVPKGSKIMRLTHKQP